MKEHHLKKRFKDEISNILLSEKDLEKALKPLKGIYHSIGLSLSPAFSFKLELIETKSIRYSVFYEGSPDMSKHTIMITNESYEAYLWTDCNGWCLDDHYYDIEEISFQLSNAPIMNKVPENVRELKKLLDDKYWSFNNGQLPSFEGDKPKDDDEVLSWDSAYVLTDTRLDNLASMKREEWDELCAREQNWFKQ